MVLYLEKRKVFMKETSKYQKIFIRLGIIIFIVVALIAVVFYFYGLQSYNRPEETNFVFNGWRYNQEDQKETSSVLSKAGLSRYSWQDGMLVVPQSEKEQYETVLAENKAFPKAPSDIRREALREMGPFESESKSRMRDLYASAQQLEKTIEQFSTKIGYATVGVRSRREQVGLVNQTVITASIGVWTKEENPITTELLSSITLAARHQLGIKENNDISILDLRLGQSWLGTDIGIKTPQFEYQQQEEKEWKTKFESTFVHIPGIKIDVKKKSSPACSIPTLASIRTGAVLGCPGREPFASDYRVARTNTSSTKKTFISSTEVPPIQQETTGELFVNIAIPKSYIQQTVGKIATPGQNPQEVQALTQRKTNELLETVRQDAMTLLPVEEQGKSDSRPQVQVSVFNDHSVKVPVVPQSVLSQSVLSQSKTPIPSIPSESSLESDTSQTANKKVFSIKTELKNIWDQHYKECLYMGGGSILFFLIIVMICIHIRSTKSKQNKKKETELSNTLSSETNIIETTSDVRKESKQKEPQKQEYLYDSTRDGEDEWEKIIQLIDEEDVNNVEDPQYIRLDLKGHTSSENSLPILDQNNDTNNINNSNTDNETHFSYLATDPSDKTAMLLKEERPSIIAAILLWLPLVRRNEILALLEENKRNAVTSCLAKKPNVRTDLLNALEIILNERRKNTKLESSSTLSV